MPLFDPTQALQQPMQTGPQGLPNPPQIPTNQYEDIVRGMDKGSDYASNKTSSSKSHVEHLQDAVQHFKNYDPKAQMAKILQTPEGMKVAHDTIKSFPEIFGEHTQYIKKA